MSNFCFCYWFALYQAIISGTVSAFRMGQFHVLLISPYSRPGSALHGETELNVKQSIDFPYISKPFTYLQTRKHDDSQTLGSDYLEV